MKKFFPFISLSAFVLCFIQNANAMVLAEQASTRVYEGDEDNREGCQGQIKINLKEMMSDNGKPRFNRACVDNFWSVLTSNDILPLRLVSKEWKNAVNATITKLNLCTGIPTDPRDYSQS